MENKNNVVYPGTVFLAKHYDQFTKQAKIHPFVCVYNQAFDPELNTESNIIGLLITSNNKQAVRQIEVSKGKNSFLDKDSFAYCDNIYSFPLKDIKPIGTLDSETFYQIVQKRQLLLRAENDQCVKALMNMKSFESKKIVEKKAKYHLEKVKKQLVKPEKVEVRKAVEPSALDYFETFDSSVRQNPPYLKKKAKLKRVSKKQNEKRQGLSH